MQLRTVVLPHAQRLRSKFQSTTQERRTEHKVIKHSSERLRNCCMIQTLSYLVTDRLFITTGIFISYPISLIKPEVSGVGKSR